VLSFKKYQRQKNVAGTKTKKQTVYRKVKILTPYKGLNKVENIINFSGGLKNSPTFGENVDKFLKKI